MNVGIYKGAAAMAAYEHWQEAIAQNLASSSVNGYRRNEISFKGTLGEVVKLKDGQQRVQKELKGVLPESTSTLNTTPGSVTHTGIETNFAIEGEGFFKIRKPDGTFGYTRNGGFRLNDQRELTTQQGYTVEGENGPIKFKDEGGAILLNSKGFLIQGQQQIGRMPIYQFEKPGDMTRIGDGLLAPAEGDRAREPEKAVIAQMAVEASNVDALHEMVNMVTVSRAYEMANKVVQLQDDTVGKAIQSLGTPLG